MYRQQVQGNYVGTINHSKSFPPAFLRSLYKVMLCRLRKWLTTPDAATGQLPPFAAAADKMTSLHRTGQMSALIILVGGELKALMGSITICKDGTAKGIADNLYQQLCSN